MIRARLIETRGEEPAVLPGPAVEAWQRVDYGLGASQPQAAPDGTVPPAPRGRRAGRTLAWLALAAAALLLAARFRG